MLVQRALADAKVSSQIIHVKIRAAAVDFMQRFGNDLFSNICRHSNTSYVI